MRTYTQLFDGSCIRVSFSCFHVRFDEVFHQQAVDEDISATDAAQEDQVNAVVEEGDEIDWNIIEQAQCCEQRKISD